MVIIMMECGRRDDDTDSVKVLARQEAVSMDSGYKDEKKREKVNLYMKTAECMKERLSIINHRAQEQ